jgi:DNA processing protein
MSEALSPEQRDLLALHLVPGLGPRLTSALLERFGSPAGALQATAAQLQELPHIGAKLAQSLSAAMRRLDVAAELELMAQQRVRVLVRGSSDFPASLNDIPDPPHLLYLRGTLQPGDARSVALVGSRQYTGYGRRMAERLATELARAGFAVVSGLARGIDGIAHRAALTAGGRTLAVLAGGLSKIYPPEHTMLAQEIETAGALLTEAPMRMEPMAAMFPARNRLISGLARGVVVVEAAAKSGALITARHAAEQGRPVFAVPGPLDSPSSVGVHHLVRQGAILIRGVEDILEELEGVQAGVQPFGSPPAPQISGTERRIWDFLEDEPRHVDQMAQTLGLSVPEITTALLALELRKAVRRMPGNQYERR